MRNIFLIFLKFFHSYNFFFQLFLGGTETKYSKKLNLQVPIYINLLNLKVFLKNAFITN